MNATITRTGTVLYPVRLHGLEPKYFEARVEEYTFDGLEHHYCYYPTHEMPSKTPRDLDLPTSLLPGVRWDT